MVERATGTRAGGLKVNLTVGRRCIFSEILQRPTLVLNRNWQPGHVATMAPALVVLWNKSARIVRFPRPQAHLHHESGASRSQSQDGSNPSSALGYSADDEHLQPHRPA
jgi:hypothetical protein